MKLNDIQKQKKQNTNINRRNNQNGRRKEESLFLQQNNKKTKNKHINIQNSKIYKYKKQSNTNKYTNSAKAFLF